jgi:hypothetical protein
LGAALIGGAGIALIACIGANGWLAAGIIAAGLAAANWHDKVFGWVKDVDDAMNKIGASIKSTLQSVVDWIKSFLPSWMHASYQGGGLGGGGGVINASYGSLNATQSQVKDYITQATIARGIDPAIARQVSWNESKFGGSWVGDHGMSYGVYQDYLGGGLGNEMMRAGIDPRNKGNWKRAVDWNLDVAARKHSWRDWHGWKGAPGAGLGHAHPARSGGDQEVHIDYTIVLDGAVIARSTTKHQLASARHQTQAPFFDGSREWIAPGEAHLTDV